ncbi:flavodoxin FldB [Aurantivibrio plasticivorans]
MTIKIGLFYGSTTCYTEIAAEKIQAQLVALDNQFQVDLHNVKEIALIELMNYELLILGIPTWDYGELQEHWEARWSEFADLDLSGKIVALYGLGDQIGYPEWFQDALGYLYQEVTQCGATCVGFWPAAGYEFENSLALTEDKQHFFGLVLDEENEFDLSDERILAWCKILCTEFTSQSTS